MLRRFLKLIKAQIFKAILPSQLKYCVMILEIIPEISFWKRHDRGRYISDSHVIQGYLYFLFIYCITLFEIIPEIVFGKRHDPGLNSFIQKDCVIVYCCVTGNHTGNYFLITSCLSVTFPPRIVVLKLSNKVWFLRQELSNFHRFNCQVLLRSYSFHLPLQKV